MLTWYFRIGLAICVITGIGLWFKRDNWHHDFKFTFSAFLAILCLWPVYTIISIIEIIKNRITRKD